MKTALRRILSVLRPWRRGVETPLLIPPGGVPLYAYETPERFVRASWHKKKLQLVSRAVRLPRRKRADYVVVIDRPLDEPGKALLVELATNQIPLVIGPKAQPTDFFWEVKDPRSKLRGI